MCFFISFQKVNVHDTLVFTLCSEVLKNPLDWLTKVFIRCLNSLHLTPTNYSSLRQLDVIASKLMKVCATVGCVGCWGWLGYCVKPWEWCVEVGWFVYPEVLCYLRSSTQSKTPDLSP